MPEYPKIGVIAAAGKGTRAYPRSTQIHKTVFEIQGKTLLRRNAEILASQIGVEKIYVLAGHLEDQVRAAVEEIRRSGISADIEVVGWTRNGLAADVASLEGNISGPFVVILGDEFYDQPDHAAFLKFMDTHGDFSAAIGYVRTPYASKIQKNYSVLLEGDRVTRLVEKPSDPPNDMLGVGSYLLSPSYFEAFKNAPPSPRSGVVELTDVLDRMAKQAGNVFAVPLTSGYFNINTMQDYHQAVYDIRHDQFSSFRTSLVIPGGKQAKFIDDVVQDFKDKVDEVILLDGAFTGDRVMDGFDQASGDLLILVSPDGAFRSKDLPKFFEYMKDSEMVVGTRVTRQMIEQDADLKPLTRLANLFLGKLIDLLWWNQQPRFSDVDCRYLCIWKTAYQRVRPQLSPKAAFPVAELMIEVVRQHMRCLEIPVTYHKIQNAVRQTFWQRCWNVWTVGSLIVRKRFQPVP